MPKISVIIPIYNSEKYIARCLDSVINQTLSDIEIICINDCSSDNSLEILKKYASKNKKIKLINLTKNKGAAFARNLGIDESEGEFLSFVDSDDYLEKDFLQLLYNNALKSNADIAKGYYKFINENLVIWEINKKIEEEKTNFAFDFCSAIYKKALIKENKIYFPNISDFEDPIFSFLCANKANKIAITKNAYINIYKHNDSQTSKPLTIQRLKDKIKGYEKLIELADKYNISENSFGYILSNWFCALFYNIENLNIEDRIFLKDKAISFLNKIKYKKEFMYYLEKNNPVVHKIILNNQTQDFIYIDKVAKIKQLEGDAEQLNNSINTYKNLCKNYIEKYAIPIIKNNTANEQITIISVVNDYNLYNKLIKNNAFIENCKNINLADIDNTINNDFIPKLYNNFLNKYNYTKESWFLFCHNDWQLLEDINPIIQKLDKNCLFGPIGSKFFIIKNKYYSPFIGHCLEKERNGNKIYKTGELSLNFEEVDTFDCQALIVHSSLIEKYNLRFDENLTWDLYVEDFCINSRLKYDIKSYATHIDCCHWSGYHKVPATYFNSLDYLNNKYPNVLFSGTCSLIGGLKNTYEKAGYSEYMLYKMRKNVLKARQK